MDLKHFRYCLSSYDNYGQIREIKWRILCGDKVIITQVLTQIATYLADKNELPIIRFLSIRLNKDLVETFNEEYIKMMQRIFLPVMELIVETVHKHSQNQNGRQFFEGDTQEISRLGEQFIRMNLECIFIWSKWFPVNEHRLSNFKVVYQRLIHIGVVFPKVTIYDFDSIIKYLPSDSVPLDVLKQSKQLIKLGQSTRQVCKSLYLNPLLKTGQSYKTIFRTLCKKTNRQGPQSQQIPQQIKSEITSFTACVLQKNEELNKLVIQLQNQTVLLQKENNGRQTIIDCLEQQIIIMTKEFQTLKLNQPTSQKLYFDRDLISYEVKQELAQLKTTAVKLQIENAFYRQKIEEMKIQTDILQTEKQSIQQDNFKSNIQKNPSKTEIFPSDNLKIIAQQITIIQLRQQLQMIREHISGDRLNQSRESIVMKKEYSQQQTLMSTRNSKQNILSMIEYNPQIFSIYPEALNMNFKQACLINKSILYQDDQLSITASSNLDKAYLELILNCNNKTQTQLTNFEIKYNQNPSIQFNQATKSMEIIPATGTIQQKIQIKYNTIPYQLLEGEIRYIYKNQQYKRYICLPCTINKFFDYQVVQAVLPQNYNYSSKQFATSNLNLQVLLPDFVLRQEEYIARVIFEQKQFLIAIRSANSLMHIRVSSEPCDRICETIVSTYQGLFIRRN